MNDEVGFVRHVACPSCGSSDANALYSDGHTYCHKCGTHAHGDGAPQQARSRVSSEFLQGDVRDLPARAINAATCAKFGYRVGQNDKGKNCQIADYRDDSGVLVAQKVRFADKKFTVIGSGGKDMPLFGQHLWQRGGKRLVITEGEIDALSVAQATGLTWPVVSIPNGADGAVRSIRKNIDFVTSFEQVVLAFDQDEPGRAAALEVAQLLPPGKAFIAEMPRKDANEMLKEGEVKALSSLLWQARAFRPDGIVALGDIDSRVLSEIKPGLPWCFPGITAATFGRQLGDVIGVGAAVGAGKTDYLLQQMHYDIVVLGQIVGCLMLEQDVGETGTRLAGKEAKKTLHLADGSWTPEEKVAAWEKIKATNRLFLYDNFGAMDWETIKARILYLHEALGCTVIYLDHLTALVAGEEDERRALDAIMADLAGMAKGRFIVIFVSHLTTPEGKAHEEGGRVMAKHFTGSRAIMRWAHGLWGLERNQQAEDPEERRTTTIRCLKDRLSGRAAGMTWRVVYDGSTGMLSEADDPVEAFGKESGGERDF